MSKTVTGVMFRCQFKDSSEGDGGLRIHKNTFVYPSFLHSLFTAKRVAESLTGKRFKHDIVFESLDYEILKDESAGMMLTLILMSKLTGIPLRKGVNGTGKINPDGTISPAGYIKEKALAVAMDQGAGTVFMVSKDQEHEPIRYLKMRYVKDIKEAWEIARSE